MLCSSIFSLLLIVLFAEDGSPRSSSLQWVGDSSGDHSHSSGFVGREVEASSLHRRRQNWRLWRKRRQQVTGEAHEAVAILAQESSRSKTLLDLISIDILYSSYSFLVLQCPTKEGRRIVKGQDLTNGRTCWYGWMPPIFLVHSWLMKFSIAPENSPGPKKETKGNSFPNH